MDQSRKLPIFSSLVATAQQQAQRTEHMTGRCMPASVVSVSGRIVTVNFEVKSEYNLPQIQVPLFGSEYIRTPIQKGCKGFVIPADYYMGGMSGLGSGVATLAKQGNLSNLVFFPVGNKNWAETDGDTLTLYGENGSQISDKLSPTATVSVRAGKSTMSSPASNATENFSVGNGATGSFTTNTGLTVTVRNGIITNIY